MGQFSDEPNPRLIGNPGDYVYPCDIRINASHTRLYAEASGIAMNNAKVTIVFEFDIPSRNLVQTYYVDPALLPKCPPIAPAA